MLAVRIDLNLKTILWEATPFKSGTSSRLVIENDDRYGWDYRLVIEWWSLWLRLSIGDWEWRSLLLRLSISNWDKQSVIENTIVVDEKKISDQNCCLIWFEYRLSVADRECRSLHREPRQSVCRNLKDLYGNILRFISKSKYWVEFSYSPYIDQNKRKLTSPVVFCRPCGWEWRISAFWRFCVRRLPESNKREKGRKAFHRTAPGKRRTQNLQNADIRHS